MTETAFQSIYRQYRDPLFRFAYRLTGSPPVAEDLVHDCFVSLLRGGFDERRGPLKTYLFAIVRNLSRKYHRDDGRGEPEDELLPDGQSGPLETVISLETAAAVRRAVEILPLLQREVLVLFEYEDLSLDEIAKVVSAEVGAVKSRLSRARENLRRCLAPLMREAAR